MESIINILLGLGCGKNIGSDIFVSIPQNSVKQLHVILAYFSQSTLCKAVMADQDSEILADWKTCVCWPWVRSYVNIKEDSGNLQSDSCHFQSFHNIFSFFSFFCYITIYHLLFLFINERKIKQV